MAVKSVGPASRPGSRHWRPTLQRGIDAVSEYADVAAQKLGAVSDPRARLLRKRRWALRFGVFFSFATAFWVFVTGLLAVWNTPVWALLITGLVAAGAAVPATLWLLRYRWLRGEPLPPQREVSGRRLPPQGSVARPAISALGASERGLHSLLGVIQRGAMLPAEPSRPLQLSRAGMPWLAAFFALLLVLPLLSIFETPRQLPKSISEPVLGGGAGLAGAATAPRENDR